MWRLLAESVIGTSHVRSDKPCQDRCHTLRSVIRAQHILIAACADGAGSASASEVGAQTAIESVMALILRDLDGGLEVADLSRDDGVRWYREALAAMTSEAAARVLPLHELACTLLVAVVGETHAVFVQIGDGAIVIREGEGYAAVFWPQQGEYANTTFFLTSATMEERLEFSLRDAPDALALFTDGLQNLTLEMAARTPHTRFFDAMFKQLATAEAAEELIAPLRAFLDSPSVNQRTDDDKSLILAWRPPVERYAAT